MQLLHNYVQKIMTIIWITLTMMITMIVPRIIELPLEAIQRFCDYCYNRDYPCPKHHGYNLQIIILLWPSLLCCVYAYCFTIVVYISLPLFPGIYFSIMSLLSSSHICFSYIIWSYSVVVSLSESYLSLGTITPCSPRSHFCFQEKHILEAQSRLNSLTLCVIVGLKSQLRSCSQKFRY